MQTLYLSLKSGGRIKIKVKADNKLSFTYAVDNLKKIPVIKFVKEVDEKYYLSSIFHYDQICKIAHETGMTVYVTDKLESYYKRFLIRMNSIKKERENIKFYSNLWTEDSTLKVLDYQAKAVNVIYRAKRFLLGDDMGCGKTIIALGVICKFFEENEKGKVLIICPNRLKYQWKGEILKFTKFEEKDISVIDIHRDLLCVYHEDHKLILRDDRCKFCERCKLCKMERINTSYRIDRQLSEGKIVIFNYELIVRMIDLINERKFDIVIIDEASRMKNVQAQTTKAIIKMVDSLSKDSMVIPMSGTFIENKIDEIYPPLSLINKGILGEFHNFKNNYLVFDWWGKVIGTRNEKSLKKIIDPWIIRRSIDEVWENRPKLIEITKVCDMTAIQRKIYENAKDGILKELKNKEAEDKINYAEIGALLNYLIQICDSTETMDPGTRESGKLDVLKEIVTEEIASRHKVLIFSFFANKMIPLIKREMMKYGDCMVITGNTLQTETEKIKNRFIRSNSAKFLICSDTMAYGANLQCANYVINFDLPWNPAKINQRIGRVYRIGQKETVTVINLVTTFSVEDKILERIGFKRRLFDEFLGISTAKKPKSLSLEDMLDILRAK